MGHDAATTSPQGRVRVLVVDDDRAVCHSVTTILLQHGYQGQAVTTLAEAFSTIDLAAKPDLIVADLVMPEAGGLELLAHVHESWPDIPVLLMTGFPSAATAVKAIQLGARGYLPKPFTGEELAAAVAAIVPPRGAPLSETDDLMFKFD